MTITLTVGWWIIPFVVTLLAYGVAFYGSYPTHRSGYFDGVITLLFFGASTIVALAVWLVWAVLV